MKMNFVPSNNDIRNLSDAIENIQKRRNRLSRMLYDSDMDFVRCYHADSYAKEEFLDGFDLLLSLPDLKFLQLTYEPGIYGFYIGQLDDQNYPVGLGIYAYPCYILSGICGEYNVMQYDLALFYGNFTTDKQSIIEYNFTSDDYYNNFILYNYRYMIKAGEGLFQLKQSDCPNCSVRQLYQDWKQKKAQINAQINAQREKERQDLIRENVVKVIENNLPVRYYSHIGDNLYFKSKNDGNIWGQESCTCHVVLKGDKKISSLIEEIRQQLEDYKRQERIEREKKEEEKRLKMERIHKVEESFHFKYNDTYKISSVYFPIDFNPNVHMFTDKKGEVYFVDINKFKIIDLSKLKAIEKKFNLKFDYWYEQSRTLVIHSCNLEDIPIHIYKGNNVFEFKDKNNQLVLVDYNKETIKSFPRTMILGLLKAPVFLQGMLLLLVSSLITYALHMMLTSQYGLINQWDDTAWWGIIFYILGIIVSVFLSIFLPLLMSFLSYLPLSIYLTAVLPFSFESNWWWILWFFCIVFWICSITSIAMPIHDIYKLNKKYR